MQAETVGSNFHQGVCSTVCGVMRLCSAPSWSASWWRGQSVASYPSEHTFPVSLDCAAPNTAGHIPQTMALLIPWWGTSGTCCSLSCTLLLPFVLHGLGHWVGYSPCLPPNCQPMAFSRPMVCHFGCLLCVCFFLEDVGLQSTPAHSSHSSPQATPPQIWLP